MDQTSGAFLRVGDYVTLRNIKTGFDGYLAADGILQSDVVVKDEPNLFEDSLFCIHLQRQYAACTELNEFLDSGASNDVDPEDKHTKKYLNALMVFLNCLHK